MNRLSLLLLLVWFTACDNNTSQKAPDGLLSTDIVKNPRSATGDDTAALAKMGHLTFKDTVHNFGDIKDGDIVICEFEYKNTGSEPILINEAKGSCGCTIPEFNHNPIQPGEEGSIKISFDSKDKKGYQAKKISVYTNGNPKELILEILAKVN